MPAPSTLGTFLRSFSWADSRSLDKVAAELLKRAWAAGAGPGSSPLTIDVDSSICRAYGLKKQGVAFGYTKVRGLHPLVATRVWGRRGARGTPEGRQRPHRQRRGELPHRDLQQGTFWRGERAAHPPG